MSMKSFQVGIKGVIVNDLGQVLLLKSQKGYWEFPGGRVDDAEELTQALNRELNEELVSIKDIKIGQVIHAVRMPFDLKDDLGLVLVFYKVKASFYDDVEISDEHTDYCWVTIDEARKLCGSELDEVFNNL